MVKLLPGMTWSTLKKVPELSPVWLIFAAGTTGATLYLARLALYNPDVTWNRTKNPEPYQHYANKQYKFYDEAFKHVPKSPAPEY